MRPFHEHIAHLVLQLSIRLNILFLKYSPGVSNVYGRAIQIYILLIKDIVAMVVPYYYVNILKKQFL